MFREERGTWFLLERETEGAKSQRCVTLEINTNMLIFKGNFIEYS